MAEPTKVYRVELATIVAAIRAKGKDSYFYFKPFGAFSPEAYSSDTAYNLFNELWFRFADKLHNESCWYNLGWDTNEYYRSGCLSLEHIREWFHTEIIQHLKEEGFVIAVYNVYDITYRCDVSNQVAYYCEDAYLLETMDLDTLLSQ